MPDILAYRLDPKNNEFFQSLKTTKFLSSTYQNEMFKLGKYYKPIWGKLK